MDVAEMDIAACPLTLISDRDLKDQKCRILIKLRVPVFVESRASHFKMRSRRVLVRGALLRPNMSEKSKSRLISKVTPVHVAMMETVSIERGMEGRARRETSPCNLRTTIIYFVKGPQLRPLYLRDFPCDSILKI
jgi:hypothetical protein